jgi:hypothetical protein
VEEIRERVFRPEDISQLVGIDDPVAGSSGTPPGVGGPLAAERTSTILGGLLVVPPVGAQFVVLAPLLRIAKHFVGLVDLLEARFGGLIAGVQIRMRCPGKFPVRLLDLCCGGRLLNAKRLIVVLEFH